MNEMRLTREQIDEYHYEYPNSMPIQWLITEINALRQERDEARELLFKEQCSFGILLEVHDNLKAELATHSFTEDELVELMSYWEAHYAVAEPYRKVEDSAREYVRDFLANRKKTKEPNLPEWDGKDYG